jgi:N-acetylneuraminate synthase
LKPGQELSREHIEVLRPCPHDGIRPFQLDDVLGRKVRVPLKAGQHVKWSDLT